MLAAVTPALFQVAGYMEGGGGCRAQLLVSVTQGLTRGNLQNMVGMGGSSRADHGAARAGEAREDKFEIGCASGMLCVGRQLTRGSSGMGWRRPHLTFVGSKSTMRPGARSICKGIRRAAL